MFFCFVFLPRSQFFRKYNYEKKTIFAMEIHLIKDKNNSGVFFPVCQNKCVFRVSKEIPNTEAPKPMTVTA